MMRVETEGPRLYDFSPPETTFKEEVLAGLRLPKKELPCKYFYDERGSWLFERIVDTPDYYVGRVETKIMRENIDDIVGRMGTDCLLVEYGSGSGRKTRLLLDRMQSPAGYVPIDIARGALVETARRFATAYPGLDVCPVFADFVDFYALPPCGGYVTRKIVYFPGSTIGNFEPSQARELLEKISRLCHPNGGLLIGVDLKKPREILERAYDDREGLTSAFNLNLLVRINRELGGDIRVDNFRHEAVYAEGEGRVEMRLVSACEQIATIDGETFRFGQGESILTERCHKYDVDGFRRLALAADLELEEVWTDENEYFGLFFLTNA